MTRPPAPRSAARIFAAAGVLALVSASLVAVSTTASAAPTTVSQTFTYTGATQTFTVPEGITALEVSVVGGMGGNGGGDATPAPPVGTYRGAVTGVIPVEPGQILTIAVGSGGATGRTGVNANNAPLTAVAGNNPLDAYDGGNGGNAGSNGSSGQGGAGGAATVLLVDDEPIVAGGGGGNGGSGQFAPTRGRSADGTFVARTDVTSTNGQRGLSANEACAASTCSNNDGGGSGGGGGGAQGGAQGRIEFGAGSSNEWFGYGGSVGQNSTASFAGLASNYEYVAQNGGAGYITISYVTGAPSAPSAVRGVGKVAAVDLQWSAPGQPGGAPISGYVVQYSSDSGATWSDSQAVPEARTSTTISDLTNGTPYVFRVAAVSDEGTGEFSVPSAPITPYAIPSAPVLTELEPQDGSLLASFTPPATGAPVTGYEYQVDGGAWLPAAGSTSPISIPGLSNGVTYSIALRATSSVGVGAASAPMSATPVAVPGAPTITSASTDRGSVTVDFESGFSGGSPIIGYEYRLDGGAWIALDPPTSPATISGLADGTSYSLSLRAINASGAGAASEPVSVRTPGVPSAPTAVTIQPADRSLTVSYALGDSGGSSVTSVEYRVDGGSWTPVPNPGTFVIAGLSNGTEYEVQLRANNEIGAGAPSPAVAGTPRTVPSAPVITSVNERDGELDVVFNAPVFDGGANISTYEYSTDGGVTWHARQDGETTSSPVTVTTLSTDGSTSIVNGTTYPLEVRAVNAAGPGAASAVAPGVPFGPPEAPRITAAEPRSGAVAIEFAPGANGGRAITAYQYTLDNGATWTDTGSLSAAFVVSGLTNGTPVSVRVRALSSAGASEPSAARSATPATVPAQPSVTSVVRSDRTLTATILSGSDGGSPVTAWDYSTDGGSTWARAAGTSSPLVITSPSADTGTRLVNGQGYTLQVRAVNAAGTGPASRSVTVAPASAPPAPTVVLTPGDSLISVAYSLSDDGGSPIQRVEYSTDAGASWVDTTSLASPFALAGLTNGAAVSVSVRAVNAIGAGAPSAPLSATPRTVPAAPQNVTAAGNTASVDVSWSAPASNGGAAVTAYTAYAYTEPAGTSAIASCSTSGSALSCSIPGLVNGTEYFIAVVATNAAGGGTPSSPRVSATPRVRPSAPNLTALSAGDRMLTATFSAGAAGDSPITRYEYSTDSGATWRSVTGTSPVSISNLTNGTAYTVTLRAVSEAGPSPASNARTATPSGFPGVAQNIVANAGDRRIAVSWNAADANGGSIADYTVTAFNAASGGSTITTCTTAALSCDLTGLSNGTTYYVSVQTRNASSMYSVRSDPRVAATPSLTPGAPTGVTPTAGHGSVSLTWTSPMSTGASAIVGYTIYCSENGGTFTSCGSATDTSAVVSGLTNGSSYVFRVAARNGDGTGPQSASSRSVTPLAAGVAPEFGSITRTADGFTAPIENFDADASYRATASAGSVSIVDGVVTVTGLPAGGSATVTVVVSKDAAEDASQDVTGAARNVVGTPTFAAISPTIDGFSFRIDNVDSHVAYGATVTAGSVQIVDGVVTVTGLEPGESATVTIVAQRAGYTDASAQRSGTALLPGTAPVLSGATRALGGFSVTIENLDPDAEYEVSTTAGSARVQDGLVVVSALAPDETATVTVVVLRPGYTDASAERTGIALAADDSGSGGSGSGGSGSGGSGSGGSGSGGSGSGGSGSGGSGSGGSGSGGSGSGGSGSGGSGSSGSGTGGSGSGDSSSGNAAAGGSSSGGTVAGGSASGGSAGGVSAAGEGVQAADGAASSGGTGTGSSAKPTGSAGPRAALSAMPRVSSLGNESARLSVGGKVVDVSSSWSRGGMTLTAGGMRLVLSSEDRVETADIDPETFAVWLGGTVDTRFSGLLADSTFQVWIDGVAQAVAEGEAAADGVGLASFALPEGVEAGDYQLVVSGQNAEGEPVTVQAELIVVDAEPVASNTMIDLWWLWLLLLIIVILLVLWLMRRRTASRG